MERWNRIQDAVFFRVKEEFGGLSNFAGGFPLCVNGVKIRTSEALYQACRFPDHPEIQKMIIDEKSPMGAKMISKKYAAQTREDWMDSRFKVMFWTLRVKLVCNYDSFSELLLSTDKFRTIVEQSSKDDFWGAKVINSTELEGQNMLGKQLTYLRTLIKTEPIVEVGPLKIPNFSLLGKLIQPVMR